MDGMVVYCSGGLYAVQEGYMDVQEGYIIMMFKVVTNVVASQPLTTRANYSTILLKRYKRLRMSY